MHTHDYIHTTQGTSCNAGSASCHLCAIGKYSEGHTNRTCDRCGPRKITPFLGATSEDFCFDPTANFVIGGLSLFGAIAATIIYIVAGRFHRIAFLRRQRIVVKLAHVCRFLYTKMVVFGDTYIRDDYLHELEAKKKHKWYWIFITYLFIFISIILLALVTATIYITSLAAIFLKALIIWHNFRLNFKIPYEETAAAALAYLSKILQIPYLKDFFYPFIFVLKVLAHFKLDLGVVNVTCVGSTAPLELLLNIGIIGFIIIVIESQWQGKWKHKNLINSLLRHLPLTLSLLLLLSFPNKSFGAFLSTRSRPCTFKWPRITALDKALRVPMRVITTDRAIRIMTELNLTRTRKMVTFVGS